MGPKKKGGVSRRVRIAGPYTRPEAEPAPNPLTDVEESAAVPSMNHLPSPTRSTNYIHFLSQVAARETTDLYVSVYLPSLLPHARLPLPSAPSFCIPFTFLYLSFAFFF